MEFVNLLLIGGGVLCGLLFVTLIVLFFVSRKTQKIMDSLLKIMTQPERAKIADASRVLSTILADEINKIEQSFQVMRDTLNAQIKSAGELKNMLDEQNTQLITLADDATKKIATMSGRLDNTVTGLGEIVSSQSWTDVENSTDRFSSTVNTLLDNIKQTSENTVQQTSQIQSQIDSWLESAKTMSENLQSEFNFNADQMKNLTGESEILQNKLIELGKTTADGFDNIKTSADGYESTLNKNNRQLNTYLDRLETFSKQAKKQLTSQTNTLTSTANVVAGQTRLVETSIDKQASKLTDIVETLIQSASSTESAVRGISSELVVLANRFDAEIKEYAAGIITELKTVSGVANATLENTNNSATAFSDSVNKMTSSVRDTLIKMNTAHTQLSAQSENLINLSSNTTAQLEPLSALIEKYYAALPELSQSSLQASETLEKIVASLNENIALMTSTVTESTKSVSESSVKLEELAGQSRQQMIDLMSDYAKAADTMQTLNKQMMVARASAPMDAIKAAPSKSFGHISSADFLAQSEQMLAPLHEQSMDLTRVAGVEIPDIVWNKYHSGDKTIFSKWLAKMMAAADKKQIRDMIKSDTVFRRQATQFVRSFDKILTNAQQTDNPDSVSATLIKTDVGRVYIALKNYV